MTSICEDYRRHKKTNISFFLKQDIFIHILCNGNCL